MREMLNHLADQILDLDPCELSDLLPEVQARMECCDNSREWEQAVVTFFLINGVRFKKQLCGKAAAEALAPPDRRAKLSVVK